MRDKMAISAYILKTVEKDPFLRLQMRTKEDFNRHQFLCPQISNTLEYFFGKDEILLKFSFKALNYHNFHIFDHN